MTVLVVHVQDDWSEFPNNETKIFEDSTSGLNKAIDFVEYSIPWEEEHMKQYFKGCSNKISDESRNKIIEALSKHDYAGRFDCIERFPAKFDFSIQREQVEG